MPPALFLFLRIALAIHITDLKLRPDTVKVLEESTGEEIFNINLGNDFLNEAPKT